MGPVRSEAAETTGAAVRGTVIGAIAGAQGAATGAGAAGAAGAVPASGHELRVPAETVIRFRLDKPITLQAER